MNVAKAARLSKERWPEDFCSAKGCLWRTQTRHGFKPCPKHAVRFEVTPAGRDALDEEILAEQTRAELRIIDENEEGTGDLYDCDDGQRAERVS